MLVSVSLTMGLTGNYTSTIEKNLAVDTFTGDLSSAIITGLFVILTSVLFTAGMN